MPTPIKEKVIISTRTETTYRLKVGEGVLEAQFQDGVIKRFQYNSSTNSFIASNNTPEGLLYILLTHWEEVQDFLLKLRTETQLITVTKIKED